jgi:hypothetical protein
MKPHPEDDGMRVWLDGTEVQALIDKMRERGRASTQSTATMHGIAGRLSLHSGLRRDEAAKVRPVDVQESHGRHHLRVWEDYAKLDAYRETPVPADLAYQIEAVAEASDRDRTRQAVLEDLGWTIHRIWSPDWASNKQRELEEIESKVDDLVMGTVSTDGGASSVEIEEVIAEPLPESQRGGLEAAVSQWEEPQIATSLDKDFEDVSWKQRAAALSAVVEDYGPIEQEQLFKTVISRWHIQRLGNKIRSELNSTNNTLVKRERLHRRDGFVWPEEKPPEVPIRTNSGDASRSIDEIPLEEIAKAAHIILEAGTEMTKHDLILEVVRLFGYQRRGERITARVGEAVEVVVDVGGATKQTTDDEEEIQYVEMDIDAQLLEQIY